MAKYEGIEKFIFSDMYNFFLKYRAIPDEQYYWDCCAKDMEMLRFKYRGHPFAEMILDSTYSQLRHMVKNIPSSSLENGAQMTHEQWEAYLSTAKQTPPFR